MRSRKQLLLSVGSATLRALFTQRGQSRHVLIERLGVSHKALQAWGQGEWKPQPPQREILRDEVGIQPHWWEVASISDLPEEEKRDAAFLLLGLSPNKRKALEALTGAS